MPICDIWKIARIEICLQILAGIEMQIRQALQYNQFIAFFDCLIFIFLILLKNQLKVNICSCACKRDFSINS